MKQPIYYSLTCYAYSGFPKFMDSFKTLTLARAWAAQALKDGYQMVEIKRELPSTSWLGVERVLIETLDA
jgi:hypothetical protein